MDQATIDSIVVDALRNQLDLDGAPTTEISSEMVLLGSEALIDSLGLVNIVIEIEQVLYDDHNISITLVDEKAMSQRNSPFRTVGALAMYSSELVRNASNQS